MTTQNLALIAEVLELEIDRADAAERIRLQPELSRVVARLKAEGQRVPLRLCHLDAVLTDEAIEARFDNMPV